MFQSVSSNFSRNIYIDNESRTIPAVGARSNQVLDKHIRFPIPLDAIDNSDGVLTQNSGH